MELKFQSVDDVISLCNVWIKFYWEHNPENITFHEMVIRGIKSALEDVKESEENPQDE